MFLHRTQLNACLTSFVDSHEYRVGTGSSLRRDQCHSIMAQFFSRLKARLQLIKDGEKKKKKVSSRRKVQTFVWFLRVVPTRASSPRNQAFLSTHQDSTPLHSPVTSLITIRHLHSSLHQSWHIRTRPLHHSNEDQNIPDHRKACRESPSEINRLILFRFNHDVTDDVCLLTIIVIVLRSEFSGRKKKKKSGESHAPPMHYARERNNHSISRGARESTRA